MAYGLTTTVTITGDREMFERASKALRNPRPLLKQIGVLAMSSATRRLETVLKDDPDAVRSGRLAASIASGLSGSGGGDTVFKLGDDRVVVGTNVHYAAQVQFGGTIFPRDAKALAIPLRPQLQRYGISPREIEGLRFQHYTGSKPNVFGLLIDDEGEGGYGAGPLYALAWWVTQEPRPYLYWGDEDLRVIEEDLWPGFLG